MFIKKYYTASVLSICEKQHLNLIDSHPLPCLYLDPNAKSFAIHKHHPVPLHWHKEVKEGLDHDVALGVL
jgi:hypothetical protein